MLNQMLNDMLKPFAQPQQSTSFNIIQQNRTDVEAAFPGIDKQTVTGCSEKE